MTRSRPAQAILGPYAPLLGRPSPLPIHLIVTSDGALNRWGTVTLQP